MSPQWLHCESTVDLCVPTVDSRGPGITGRVKRHAITGRVKNHLSEGIYIDSVVKIPVPVS